MPTPPAGRVREHLREVLGSKDFQRAEFQSRALALIVEASLEGREIRGRELAEALYGKVTPQFIGAARQLVRELRLKLPRYYDEHAPSSLRIVLVPNEYRAVFESDPEEAAPPALSGDRGATIARPPRERTDRLIWLAILAAVAIVAIPLGRRPARPRRPASVRVGRSGPMVLDAWGARITSLEHRIVSAAGFDLRERTFDTLQMMQLVLLPAADGRSAPRVAVVSYDPEREDSSKLTFIESENGRTEAEVQLPYFHWDRPRPESLHSIDGVETIAMDFPIASVATAELDGDGRNDELLVAVNSHREYPTEVIGFDPDDPPHVLIEFWDMGNMKAQALPDWDGDGIDEVLVFGQNNEDQSARAVLLMPKGDRVLRGRGPRGRRNKLLREIAALPVVGRTFRFPTAVPYGNVLSSVRDTVDDVEWDAVRRRIRFRVRTSACDVIGKKPGRLTFSIDVDQDRVRVDFDDYDLILKMLLEDIRSGRMSDCCGIEERKDLEGYGRRLAAQLAVYDASSPTPGWHHLRAPEPLPGTAPAGGRPPGAPVQGAGRAVE